MRRSLCQHLDADECAWRAEDKHDIFIAIIGPACASGLWLLSGDENQRGIWVLKLWCWQLS